MSLIEELSDQKKGDIYDKLRKDKEIVKNIVDKLLQDVYDDLVTDIGKEKLRNSKLICDRKSQYDMIHYDDLIRHHKFNTDQIGVFISEYIEKCVIKLDGIDELKNCDLYICPVGGFCYRAIPVAGGGAYKYTVHKKHCYYNVVVFERVITEYCSIL